MAQHEVYNHLQTSNRSCLVHCQAHGQWIRRQATFMHNWAWHAAKLKVDGRAGCQIHAQKGLVHNSVGLTARWNYASLGLAHNQAQVH